MPNRLENNLLTQISVLAVLLAQKLRAFASETKDETKSEKAKSLSDEVCKEVSALIK